MPTTLELPILEVGPLRMSVGTVRQVLRPAERVEVVESGVHAVTSRRQLPVHRLANGETVIITSRRDEALQADVDGVLREVSGGGLAWVRHRLTDALQADATGRGWGAIAADVARSWIGQVSYRAEEVDDEGRPLRGREGLRPPQLGALHAVGAHWSVNRHPATIVMPTGTGKTETMLAVLAAYPRGRMLVVVPSDPLRSQTARKFLTFGLLRQLKVLGADAPNPIVGVITKRPRTIADLEILERCNVVIATMSAVTGGEAAPLAPEIAARVDTLVVDEAHHIGATGWSAFRDAFAHRRVLQFTATPFRRDGKLVDGEVIYHYPLGMAQEDGYFKSIRFEPVYEIDPDAADEAIATAAITRLREDLEDGRNHLMMARCATIDRATHVHRIYERLAPDLSPMLVHSEMTDTDARIDALRKGASRIAVCVNMLGEGFDLPELKVAAVHDLHKSLAILLQFTGRFTRTAGDNIGDATVIANIADADVSAALERLYSEDADWNKVLSELSSAAAREHAELVEFLRTSQRLDDDIPDDDRDSISEQLLRPTLSTLIYEATEFRPKRFHEGLPGSLSVRAVWLHAASSTLFFVARAEPSIKWTRSRSLRDRLWSLFVLHFDQERNLLYLSSTDHSSPFERLAEAVGGTVRLVSGDVIFRTLGRINRLIFQSVGVKKHGRRNLRYAMYTGADVAEALSLSERAGSVKSNLSGTGWEGGRPVSIGCSYKGRVWSREQGAVPRFVEWAQSVGAKIVDAGIDTTQIIANVLIPVEVTALPDKPVLGVDWPIELLSQSEERVVFTKGDREEILSLCTLEFTGVDAMAGEVSFDLVHAVDGVWASYALRVGGADGYTVERRSAEAVLIKVGILEREFDAYLTDYPLLVRFVDLTELDGNLLISPKDVQEILIPEDRFEAWDWSEVDITKESIWKDGAERRDSIQWRTAQHYIAEGFDVVFDDDAAGEAADLVCLKDEGEHIRLALIHCKFSGGAAPGERVKDVVEVSSQAVRSAKWKWKFRDLCKHLTIRERKLAGGARPTRFLAGSVGDLSRFSKLSRFREVRAEVLIVQPGLSMNEITPDQSLVLGAALTYLKETIGVDLDVICSA